MQFRLKNKNQVIYHDPTVTKITEGEKKLHMYKFQTRRQNDRCYPLHKSCKHLTPSAVLNDAPEITFPEGVSQEALHITETNKSEDYTLLKLINLYLYK